MRGAARGRQRSLNGFAGYWSVPPATSFGQTETSLPSCHWTLTFSTWPLPSLLNFTGPMREDFRSVSVSASRIESASSLSAREMASANTVIAEVGAPCGSVGGANDECDLRRVVQLLQLPLQEGAVRWAGQRQNGVGV